MNSIFLNLIHDMSTQGSLRVSSKERNRYETSLTRPGSQTEREHPPVCMSGLRSQCFLYYSAHSVFFITPSVSKYLTLLTF